ncbi:hypothetical protein Tco_1052756, partial [Tanacetum coccineum]
DKSKIFFGIVEPINPPNTQKKPDAYKVPHAKVATAKETVVSIHLLVGYALSLMGQASKR